MLHNRSKQAFSIRFLSAEEKSQPDKKSTMRNKIQAKRKIKIIKKKKFLIYFKTLKTLSTLVL